MSQDILDAARGMARERALAALGESPLSLEGAASILSVPRDGILDELLVRSRAVTESVFHRRVLVLAPCYLSSFCVNGCSYCRYNAEEAPARRWISLPEVGEEVACAADQTSSMFWRIMLHSGRGTDGLYLGADSGANKARAQLCDRSGQQKRPPRRTAFSQLVWSECLTRPLPQLRRGGPCRRRLSRQRRGRPVR